MNALQYWQFGKQSVDEDFGVLPSNHKVMEITLKNLGFNKDVILQTDNNVQEHFRWRIFDVTSPRQSFILAASITNPVNPNYLDKYPRIKQKGDDILFRVLYYYPQFIFNPNLRPNYIHFSFQFNTDLQLNGRSVRLKIGNKIVKKQATINFTYSSYWRFYISSIHFGNAAAEDLIYEDNSPVLPKDIFNNLTLEII